MSEPLSSRKKFALVLLAATQFVVVLDVSIVNVALPKIQGDLHLTTVNLQWIINAYTLVFGGCLLLGGRIADKLGRRRVYLAGLVLFAAASLGCGLSGSGGVLITMRAIQGFGAAVISPSALAILTSTFQEGKERNLALGVWGAVGGMGGAAGALLGGVLTDLLTWRWIFFINVPIAVIVFALAPRVIDESHADTGKHFDFVGAVCVTLGLTALVFGLVKGDSYGWGSAKTLIALIGAGVLLAFFVFWESRAASPLVPLQIFKNHSVTGANLTMLIIGANLYSMFFFLSLYMQEVLDYSSLRNGVGYLGIALTVVVTAAIAQSTVTHEGIRPILVGGLVCTTVALFLFARAPGNGHYWTDLFPGFVLAGMGLGFGIVAVSIASVSNIGNEEAGIASGLINTSQQVGGALGIAILLAVATARINSGIHAGTPVAHAVLSGYHHAFFVSAVIAPLAIVVALTVLPKQAAPQPEASQPIEEPA